MPRANDGSLDPSVTEELTIQICNNKIKWNKILTLFSLTINLHFKALLYYRRAKFYVYLLVILLLYLGHTPVQRGTK